MSKKVLIAGGSGMIGQSITARLLEEGYEIAWLSHSGAKGPVPVYRWNPEKGELPSEVIRSHDVLINTSGVSIAEKRWTQSQKGRILTSRTRGNFELARLLSEDPGQLSTYISSAAMGIYGDAGDRWCSENDQINAEGFLTEVCQAWEQSIHKVKDTGIRTCWFRIGLVLSDQGGALPQMLPPLKFGLSPYFGNGRQYYSWVHIEDVSRAFNHAIENKDMEGVYNLASPSPLRMRKFAQTLSAVHLGRQLTIPVPAFGLRIAFGEMADVLLNSNRLNTKKILETDFSFMYTDLRQALRDLIR